MNLRISTGVALTGMLLATGCGGGSGGVTPPTSLAPSTGAGTGATAKSGILQFSIALPNQAMGATASSVKRRPQYVSHGTASVSIFVTTLPSTATVTTTTWASATAASQVLTFSASSLTSLQGTLPLSGSAVTALTGSATGNASYAITIGNSSSVVTIGVPVTAPATTNKYIRLGAVLTDASGVVLSEGQSSSVATVQTTDGITAFGPTSVTIPMAGVPATVYFIGSTGANGLGNPTTTALVAGTGVAANSWELTAYVADYDGYVIPAQTATGTPLAPLGTNPGAGVPALAYDAGATYSVVSSNTAAASVAGGVSTFGTTAASIGFIPSTTAAPISDPLPTTSQVATFNAASATGIATPGFLVSGTSVPGTVLYAPALNYAAGIPINVIPVAAGTASVYATLNQTVVPLVGTTNGPVSGFTYTSSNYPHPSILGTPGNPTVPNTLSINTNATVTPVIQ